MAIRYLSGINVDSNTLFVDSTNNRVGIGTPSPEQQFHLQGSNLMATFQNSNTAANQYTQLEFVAGSRSAYIWLGNQNSTSWAGDGGLNIYTTTGNMDLWTAASQRMRITSGGNVLIGTTTDSGEKLVVNGTIGVPFSSTIRVAGGGFTRNDIITTGYNNISDLKDFLILEAPGSSNGKIILGTGAYANVGIRNNTPQSALDVLAQGNTAGGTMMLSGSKTNNQVKYGVITTAQYASDTETEGVGLIGGVNTSTENIVVVGGGVDELNTATSIRFFAAANTTTRGSANERMRVNAANDAGNLYIGTTSTNDYGRLIVNGFSGAWLPYIAGTSLSYNQYGIVVGSGNTANANIGGGLTLVNNTASVGAYGPVVSWSSMSAGGTYNSTYAFITGVYGGQGGDANWAIGDILFGTAQTYGASERMRIRYNGNVIINTTTDNGSTLRVNGTIYADSTITSATSVRAIEGYFNPYTSAGNVATPVYQDAIFLGPLDNDCTIQFGNEFQSTHGSYIRFRTNSASAQNTPVNVMTMFPNGKVALNQYGSGTFTSGTVAYNLGVDSAGNVMELPGGVVDGSGTANYVTKWQDANTVTNSLLYDNGTNITLGIGSAAASSTSAYGTAQFSVESNLFASSQVFTHNDTSGNYSFFALGKSKGTAAAPTIVESSEIVGAYQFWGYDGSAYREMASITSNVDGTPGAGDMPGNLRFQTTSDGASSPTERMRINAAGNLLIGTTTDSGEKMTIYGASEGAMIFQNSTSGTGAGNGLYLGTLNAENYLWTYEAQPLIFGTNNNEQVRITSAGHLGVNSAASSVFVLDVSSTDTAYNTRLYQPSTATDTYVSLILSGAMTSAIGYIGTGGSTAGNVAFRDNVVVGSQSNHPLVFNTNDSEKGRFTAGGNLLIGTTTDAGYKLQVEGSVRSVGAMEPSNTTWINAAFTTKVGGSAYGGGLALIDGTAGWATYTTGSGQFLNFSSGATSGGVTMRMRLQNNGVVRMSAYGSGGVTGTAAYSLSVDANGDIIESASPLNATSLYDLLPAGRVAYNWVGQVVNDAWTTVFTKNDNILTTGTWMVKMYVNDFSVGGGHYQYVYSGVMTWEQGTVNQTGEAAFSEVYLHRMGHAANASILYLRTAESGAAGGNIGYFQIKGNYSNTANQTIQFKFVKIF